MGHLSKIEHYLLNERTIKQFSDNNIINVLDFLNEDIERLVLISKLTYKEVIKLRRYLIEFYKSPPRNGNVFYKTSKSISSLSTGIDSLDGILLDGLPVGKIVEICGLPGSGKTQLIFTLISNIARKFNYNIIYIDTKEDFSAMRISQILREKGCTNEEIIKCLDCIKVIRIWSMQELIDLCNKMRTDEKLCKFVRMIVVDSLPCLMLQHKGEKSYDSLGLLNQFVNVFHRIGDEYKISLIVTNIFTRWNEQTFKDCGNSSQWIGNETPALGKYWQHIPSVRMNMELKSQSNERKISMEIINVLNNSHSGKITLKLAVNGIT